MVSNATYKHEVGLVRKVGSRMTTFLSSIDRLGAKSNIRRNLGFTGGFQAKMS